MDLFSPSLLDKLLGADLDAPRPTRGLRNAPDTETRADLSPRWSLQQITDSVARDLEALLNARPSLEAGEMPAYPQAARSLLTFGLTDLSALNVASDKDRQRIHEAIRRALMVHEPRLTQVEVQVRANTQVGAGLCFAIRARLRLDPCAEAVAFDAMLQPGTNHYAVSRSDLRTH
ncbi:type VI secretion system baseplate subunit TssE [Ideonella sp. B7]|uniref:type VI secretion system baseplate subunit TssE n=1 Tax=Ideonella benzenivorans TaxID=2831643 RepID=UPI001CED9E24|nr:type VI secretion system baseplate subunit TssE [Ideonella benzenivorans]MCA6218087.1 type VI secretion system baseplate subunit TssE [Ideonella benzenivorans]